MTNNTSEREINHIELFLEAMSQYGNIFAGIEQQNSLPMTNEERDKLNKEWLNYCDYNYMLAGAYVEGFSIGMGFLERYEPIPQEIWDKGEAVYNSLKLPATHAMTQEERNQFANKWMARTVINHLQIGAFKHGHKSGKIERNLVKAQEMKAKGYPIADIAEITGLPVGDLLKL